VASPTTLPMLEFFGFGVMFLLFNFMFSLVWLLLGLYFLLLMFFVFVSGFVLVTFSASIPSTDYNSALFASITIRLVVAGSF
jgi:fatty acid desaturase